MDKLSQKMNCLRAVLGLAAFAFAPQALAANDSATVKSEVKRCMDIWLPPGTSDAAQKWYNPDLRCEANKAVPKLDEARCENAVKKLAKLSNELNDMVEGACKTYIPELVADGCKQESNDPHCIDKEQEILKRASENSQAFVKKLDRFVQRLSELREISLQGAAKVYEATAYAEKYSQKVDAANQYFQNLTGDPTVGDFNKRNANQPANSLKELLSDFERHAPSNISGTSLGTPAAESIIAKRASGLDKAWRSLDQKVPSPLAYEQFVNALDTEETHLKMMQYKNDLARMTSSLQTMHATNARSMKGLQSIDGTSPPPAASNGEAISDAGNAAAAAPGLAYGAMRALGGNDTAEANYAKAGAAGGAIAGGYSAESPFTFSPIRVRGSSGATSPQAVSMGIEAPTANAAPGEEKLNRSGASRYRGSLRDALRNKLARDLSTEKTTAAASASSPGTATIKSGNEAFARPGGRALASVPNETTASFAGGEGSLSEGGFSMGGAEHEDIVNGLLADFEGAMKEGERAAVNAADIGALDSSPLFERVKIYHDRCLREGRVSAKE